MSLQLDSLALDMTRVERLVDEVINEEIYYFPIRHHSPISALHAIRAMEAIKPEIIFLELPHNLMNLLPFVIDPETKPPVAFYSAFKDTDNVLGLNGVLSPTQDVPAKFQAWYPLVDYSAEYQVVKKCGKKGIKVVFIDLPFIHQIQFLVNGKTVAKTRDRDFLLLNNEFFGEFTKSSGYRTFNETWDSLFEIQGIYQETEEYRRNFLLLAAASRATLPQEFLEADGTLTRECFMQFIIERELKEEELSPDKAMVVCGAAHAVILHQTLAKDVSPMKSSANTLNTLNTLIPFSYYSVSEFCGYGAGNRAPLYYERIWKRLQKGKTDAYRKLALNILSRAMSAVREKGELLSTADIIAAYQSVNLLASLRKREQPNIDDIRDALLTVCVKGDRDIEGKNILEGLDKYLLGIRVGKVTKKLGKFPLAIEFYVMLKMLKLPKRQQKDQLEIPLKAITPVNQEISAFLHKTEFLELSYAKCRQSQDLRETTDVFIERWEIYWSPKVDSRLLDLNLHGTTVDAVVQAILLEKIETDKAHPNLLVPLLFGLLKMRISDHLESMVNALRESIENSSNFLEVGEAFSYLTMFAHYINLRHFAIQDLNELVISCFKRASFLIPSIAAIDQSEIRSIVSTLYALIDSALTHSGQLDFELLVQMAQATIIQSANHTIRGALTGILSKAKAISRTEITRQIKEYAISQENERDKVGDFLFGLLSVSQNLMADNMIFESINHVVSVPDPPSFMKLLPGLKRCFADLPPGDRNTIIQKVKAFATKPKKSHLMKKKYAIDLPFLQYIEKEAFRIMSEWNI